MNEVYSYTRLQYRAHKNLTLEKPRRVEHRVRGLALTRGLAPELVRKIQIAAV